jgi:hypothetical protein
MSSAFNAIAKAQRLAAERAAIRADSLEKRRVAAGKRAGAALEKAAAALRTYVAACRACGEQLRLDDDRLLTGERAEDLGSCLSRMFASPTWPTPPPPRCN